MSKRYCVVKADTLFIHLKFIVTNNTYKKGYRSNDIIYRWNAEVEYIQEFNKENHIIKKNEKYYKIKDEDLLLLYEYNYRELKIDKTKQHKIYDSTLYFDHINILLVPKGITILKIPKKNPEVAVSTRDLASYKAALLVNNAAFKTVLDNKIVDDILQNGFNGVPDFKDDLNSFLMSITQKRVLIVDYENIFYITEDSKKNIKPLNKNYTSEELLPKFKIPLIYILKKAESLNINKILLVCKNDDSYQKIKHYLSNIQKTSLDLNEGYITKFKLPTSLINDIQIVKINAQCRVFCRSPSPPSSTPVPAALAAPAVPAVPAPAVPAPAVPAAAVSAAVPAVPAAAAVSAAATTKEFCNPFSKFVHVPSFGRPSSSLNTQQEQIKSLINSYFFDDSTLTKSFKANFLHSLRGCDDSIIMILYQILKNNDNIIYVLSADKDIAIDFISNQQKILPFSIEIINPTDLSFGRTAKPKEIKINLFKFPFDIPVVEDSFLTLLFENEDLLLKDIQSKYFEDSTSEIINWLKKEGQSKTFFKNYKYEEVLEEEKYDGVERTKTIPYAKSENEPELFDVNTPYRDIKGNIIKIDGTEIDYVSLVGDKWKSALNSEGKLFVKSDGNKATIKIPENYYHPYFKKYLKYKQKYLILKQKLDK